MGLAGTGDVLVDIITIFRVHKLLRFSPCHHGQKLSLKPIGLDDALSYLVAAVSLKSKEDFIIEIGGPRSDELQRAHASLCRLEKKSDAFSNNPSSGHIAAWWLNLFTPKSHAKVGRAMVESLANPMVVRTDTAKKPFSRNQSTSN